MQPVALQTRVKRRHRDSSAGVVENRAAARVAARKVRCMAEFYAGAPATAGSFCLEAGGTKEMAQMAVAKDWIFQAPVSADIEKVRRTAPPKPKSAKA